MIKRFSAVYPIALGDRRRRPFVTWGASILLCLLGFAGCGFRDGAEAVADPRQPPAGTPRLVVLITVDQMRADYLERFRPLLTGGLARLLEEAVVFSEARHDHAFTATAPGHATLVTGLYPARHGIVGNSWLDRQTGETIEAVEDDDYGESPRRLEASTLADWLRAAYPTARIISASGKDRGAIFCGGRGPDGAYWYDRSKGRFTTSSYYDSGDDSDNDAATPAWLDALHDRRFPESFYGQPWEALPEVTAAASEYGVEPLAFAPIPRGFPHFLGGAGPEPGSGFYRAFYGTPFLDAYLFEFAEAAVRGEDLGGDAVPDFLALGFSALDAVGHGYGPDSPEMLDTLLRLDRRLGEFLDFLEEVVGLEHVVVSLSSDHGVQPVPEVRQGRGEEARRFGGDEVLCFQRVGKAMRDRFGDRSWWLGGLYLDREEIEARGLDRADFETEAKGLLEACPGVARVWTATELASGEASEDPFHGLYLHTFHPHRSADLIVQPKPFVLTSTTGIANHGSPYPYDTRVPWLLRLPTGEGRQVDEAVATVDVAPTLATLLGVAVPEGLDGEVRSGVLP